jgi:ubiquinone biosynthesis accessory factor UbiK
MNTATIDELLRRFSTALPEGAAALGKDLENNFKALLQTAIERMDLVSRREFDVQTAVLLRTREKLEALEARMAAIEALLESKKNSADEPPR